MTDKVPPEQHVREFTRSCVRAGLMTREQLHDEVVEAIRSELPEVDAPADLAAEWIAEFHAELVRDQQNWPEGTDYDRLQTAFQELEMNDVAVLQGIDDHWAAKALLESRAAAGDPPRGVAWFTPSDIWHAIDEGMLEVNLWHGSTANAAPGDELLDDVLVILEKHGFDAHFDEGRIEVTAYWQKRTPV